MSRINTNVQSLIAQRVLGQNNQSLNTSLERLSTGLRINRGKDDPAGLIASENLRSQKASINAAIGNSERADQVVNIAEGGLSEVSGLLTDLQGLIVNSANNAGLSAAEKDANQLQIDSILQTIDRVASATSFQGKKLLNGSLDYTTSTPNAGVSDFRINSAKLANGQALAVQANVITSAQKAGLFLSLGAGGINLSGTGGSITIEIAGSKGSRQISFSSGNKASAITAAINGFSDLTGVKATLSGSGAGTGVRIESQEYGSAEFVTVKTVSSSGGTTGNSLRTLNATNFNTAATGGTTLSTATTGLKDSGQDVVATINGLSAIAKGRTARVATDFLDAEITFNDATGNNKAQTTGTFSVFNITGGGADFQLAGQVDIGGRVSLGVGNINTSSLGNSSVGFLSSLATGKTNAVSKATDLTKAQQIVDKTIEQVSSLRGRLGAFQKNTIGATIRSLNVSLENTSAAESTIRDANFATETAGLTRNQILVQASTNVLGLANQAPQSALSLLRG